MIQRVLPAILNSQEEGEWHRQMASRPNPIGMEKAMVSLDPGSTRQKLIICQILRPRLDTHQRPESVMLGWM